MKTKEPTIGSSVYAYHFPPKTHLANWPTKDKVKTKLPEIGISKSIKKENNRIKLLS